jgi:hypothetical protein
MAPRANPDSTRKAQSPGGREIGSLAGSGSFYEKFDWQYRFLIGHPRMLVNCKRRHSTIVCIDLPAVRLGSTGTGRKIDRRRKKI